MLTRQSPLKEEITRVVQALRLLLSKLLLKTRMLSHSFFRVARYILSIEAQAEKEKLAISRQKIVRRMGGEYNVNGVFMDSVK